MTWFAEGSITVYYVLPLVSDVEEMVSDFDSDEDIERIEFGPVKEFPNANVTKKSNRFECNICLKLNTRKNDLKRCILMFHGEE